MQIFLQLAQAMSYLHTRGARYARIEAASVMLGEHGEVQVLDVGRSRTHGGSQLDERSDVHALGVLLYELLTSERPPAEASAQRPLPPRARAPERSIPFALERACLRALAPSPEDRHPTVEALRAEVQAWLEAEADRARRHQLAEDRARAGRTLLDEFRRRKRVVVALERAAEEAVKHFEPWLPAGEKGELLAAEDRHRAARRSRTITGTASWRRRVAPTRNRRATSHSA